MRFTLAFILSLFVPVIASATPVSLLGSLRSDVSLEQVDDINIDVHPDIIDHEFRGAEPGVLFFATQVELPMLGDSYVFDITNAVTQATGNTVFTANMGPPDPDATEYNSAYLNVTKEGELFGTVYVDGRYFRIAQIAAGFVGILECNSSPRHLA